MHYAGRCICFLSFVCFIFWTFLCKSLNHLHALSVVLPALFSDFSMIVIPLALFICFLSCIFIWYPNRVFRLKCVFWFSVGFFVLRFRIYSEPNWMIFSCFLGFLISMIFQFFVVRDLAGSKTKLYTPSPNTMLEHKHTRGYSLFGNTIG